MTPKELVASVVQRFGYDVFSARRAGVRYWRDIDRIKPFQHFTSIVDVGAHHGQSSLEYASRAPHARIYSFEPASENFRELVRSTRHVANVVCVQSAVGHEDCTMTLNLSTYSQAHSLVPGAPLTQGVFEIRDAPRSQTVPVTTLDRFVTERGLTHIDLLKTDTEGFDLQVLRGARRTLRRGMVDFLYTEVAFEDADTQHTRFHDAFAEASESGFRFLGLYEVSHSATPWRISYCNALFTRL